MLEKINEKLSLEREIIDALPVNNEENTKKFLEIANSSYKSIEKIKEDVLLEMKRRLKLVDDSLNKEDLQKEDKFLLDNLNLTNPSNSSFEKLNFDILFYNLDYYYLFNFELMLQNIKKIINLFEEAGVTLKEKDFFFDKTVNSFMKDFFKLHNENSLKLKEVFEDYYWKNPDIVKDISLNLKTLYFNHLKKFEKYVKNNNLDFNQLIKSYEVLFKNREKNNFSDFEIYNNFKTSVWDIQNFKEENIESLKKELLKESEADYVSVLRNFNYTLKEYQNILKYEELFQKMTEEVKALENVKPSSKKALKEIRKIEKKLKRNFFFKKETERELLDKIEEKYLEFEEIYFKEKLKEHVTKDTTIKEGILFLLAYRKYFYKLINKDKEEEEILEFKEALKELRSLAFFCLNPTNTLISNLNLLHENDFDKIILGKYRLDNLNLKMNELDKDTISSLILKTDILIIDEEIKRNKNLSLEKINEYLSIYELLKNIEG